jgi:hypothetical protein
MNDVKRYRIDWDFDAVEETEDGIWVTYTAYADMEAQRDALFEAADIDDAVCMADGHHHPNIVSEKICSLRFQRDSAIKRAENAERELSCDSCRNEKRLPMTSNNCHLCSRQTREDLYTHADSERELFETARMIYATDVRQITPRFAYQEAEILHAERDRRRAEAK